MYLSCPYLVYGIENSSSRLSVSYHMVNINENLSMTQHKRIHTKYMWRHIRKHEFFYRKKQLCPAESRSIYMCIVYYRSFVGNNNFLINPLRKVYVIVVQQHRDLYSVKKKKRLKLDHPLWRAAGAHCRSITPLPENL